jgi:hypothetical protein
LITAPGQCQASRHSRDERELETVASVSLYVAQDAAPVDDPPLNPRKILGWLPDKMRRHDLASAMPRKDRKSGSNRTHPQIETS